MNQRYQNAEIRLVNKQFAEDELYKAVSSIGSQLESEMPEFGLCPEECFVEVLELLSVIAEKGEDILPETDNLWLRMFNEYRRFNRQVKEDEIRKAVGIVFGFTVLAIDSSRHPFYRRILSEQFMQVVANHKFDGWSSTFERIFSVPLPDGWFDAYIVEESERYNVITVSADSVDSLSKQKPKAVVPAETETEKNEIIGIPTGAEAEENDIISKYDHFVEVVNTYNFLGCPAVVCLSEKQRGRLVRKIVSRHDNYGAYAIAMLCELNYDIWMKDNYAKAYPKLKSLTKKAIQEHWKDALSMTNLRAVAGNYNVIRNPNGNEDRSVYKASEYTKIVHDDYMSILNDQQADIEKPVE